MKAGPIRPGPKAHKPVLAALDRARASPGMPLTTATRAALEPRFGYDFGRVRIHADTAADRAARLLGASAFTVGEHVFFGADRGAPEHPASRHVLAHELAHVVQQRAAGATGRTAADDIRLNDPADRFERAAERAAVASAAPSSGAAAGLAAAVPGAGPPTIQRFLAGEDGHGGVEEKALRDAGLTEAEYRETYYGNWLRDFSQQLPGWKFELFRTLGRGEFGREPSDQDFGRYLPSEHVDNPAGGHTPEDPVLLGKAAHGDTAAQAELADKLKQLSPEQKDWVRDEKGLHDEIGARAATSQLPEYVELGKEHVRRKLADSARLGRTPQGLLALGNGLHAVEDYFAHSNFVEVALAQLMPDDPRLAAVHRYPGIDPVAGLGTDRLGRPKIVTGTSAPGAGDKVGHEEFLKTELQDHEVLKNATLGFLKNPWAAGRSLSFGPERDVLGAIFGGVAAPVGAALGAGIGLLSGAGRGAAQGWHSGHGFWSKLGHGIGGLFGGAASGLAHGLVGGGRIGWQAGQAVGAGVSQALGVPLVLALLGVVGGIEAAPVLGSLLQANARWRMRVRTGETITEDPTLTPTHSQIAKDDPEHPLHNAAARLAYVADLAIARAMIPVWNPDRQASVSTAQDLIDVYMAHPGDGTWWQEPLRQVMARRHKAGAVGSGQSTEGR